MHFINEPPLYHEALIHIRTRIKPAAELPEQVFQPTPQRVAMFAFEEVFRAEFWDAVRSFAIHYGDTAIFFSVLSPDAERYFYKEFGYYPSLVLPVETSPGEYLDSICYEPADSPADSLMYNSRVLAFVSQSGGVAILADRQMEIGILALYETHTAPPRELPSSVDWLDVSTALEQMAPAFKQGHVPEDVKRALTSHYGGS